MSKRTQEAPQQGKHFANSPAEATFHVKEGQDRVAPHHKAAHTASEPHSRSSTANDDEATRLIAPGQTAEPPVAVPTEVQQQQHEHEPSGTPSQDSEETVLMTPDYEDATKPVASASGSGEETRLMAGDPSEEATQLAQAPSVARTPSSDDATRLAAVPDPTNLPTAKDKESAELAAVPSPADEGAMRLISPEDETNEVLFPEHEETSFENQPTNAQAPIGPRSDGVVLGKNEIAAMPVHHTGYSNDNATPYISRHQAQKTPEDHHHTRKVAAAIVCIVILAGLAGICLAFYRSFMSSTEVDEVPQYNTATIQAGEFVDSIDGSSVLRPVQTQDMVPQVSGTISAVNVQDGQQVAKGDVLFTLENQTITDEATKAKAAADQAQQEVDSKTQDQTKAQQELDAANSSVSEIEASMEELLGLDSGTLAEIDAASDTGDSSTDNSDSSNTDASDTSTALQQLQQSVSEAENKLPAEGKSRLSDLQTQLQAAKDKVTEAKAKVDSATTALQTANDSLSTLKSASDKAADQVNKLTITAPFAGTVSNLSDTATQGSEVTGSSVLCTVNDVSQFIVTTSVPEGKIGQVSVGQTARLTFPDLPDLGTIEASVTKIGSTPAQSGGTTVYPVTITISEPDSSLQEGTTVQSSIILQTVPDSLIVPIEAVQTADDGSTYLDVLLDPTRGIHTTIQVTVTASSDTQAAVESPNIQADTQVILPDSSDSSSS